MGYSTKFKGSLKFTEELTASQLAKLKRFFGEDCRDHPEWIGTSDLSYIDLKFLEDFSGIEWDGAEKTYSLEKLVNVVILNMRQEYPAFGLSGKLAAQGESFDDRWELVIGEDGLAHHINVVIVGTKLTCPHCEEQFVLED